MSSLGLTADLAEIPIPMCYLEDRAQVEIPLYQFLQIHYSQMQKRCCFNLGPETLAGTGGASREAKYLGR